MKINKSNKLVCNLYAKKVCYSHKKLKTNIKSWISFENYMNIKFRKKQKKKKKILKKILERLWKMQESTEISR